MPIITESEHIKGVFFVQLTPHTDERGRFLETFRMEWFPQRTWRVIQTNRSDSKAGVLRGLHFHRHQVDYWYAISGRLRAGLADIRPDSPSFRVCQTVEMGDGHPIGLYVPIGVAHGFVALTDVVLTYIVDNYYDSSDEYGIAWNDRDLNLPWSVTDPLLSARDAANPRLADIPSDLLPRYLPDTRHDESTNSA